jgi:hypothetical protein
MTADVNRHLLFGLIALQVGLIDQAQLVAAFQAWVRDKARPLADHLADRGGPDADGRAVVEAMVVLHVKKHGGDTERSLASISCEARTNPAPSLNGGEELRSVRGSWGGEICGRSVGRRRPFGCPRPAPNCGR